jgi:hypothetical protein
MADIERALGRPERAIDLARGPEARELDTAGRIELAIVAAGARRDLGELDAAVVALQIPELDPARRDPWSARLSYAYADNLLAAGRDSDAVQWFVHAADADQLGETDAAHRIAQITGDDPDDADDGDDIAFGEEDAPEPRAAVVVDTEDVDTEDVDTEDVDTEDVDTEDVDTEDVDTEDVDRAGSGVAPVPTTGSADGGAPADDATGALSEDASADVVPDVPATDAFGDEPADDGPVADPATSAADLAPSTEEPGTGESGAGSLPAADHNDGAAR